MNIESTVVENTPEQAGYLELSGEHLYTVLHKPKSPIAKILLVGPFATERHYSYIPWVRWARFLADQGIEVLRYDYRGVGESTGEFGDMTFEKWCEDVAFLAAWLKARSPALPLVLHGLELGALLASKIFAAGMGDALLMWGAPKNAHELLRGVLLRRVVADQAFRGKTEQKPFSDYVQRLDVEPIEVEGYGLSGTLWQESLKFETPLIEDGGSNPAWACGRPIRVTPLDKRAAPLVKGSTMGYLTVNPDLTGVFTDNFEWITNAVAAEVQR